MQKEGSPDGDFTAPEENAKDVFSERRNTSRLSPTETKVAAYIDKNRTVALISSAAELGRCTGTSDATVVRTAQALGFESLAEMRRVLAATVVQQSSPAANMRRTLAGTGQNMDRAISAVLDTHLEALEALAKEGQGMITQAVHFLLPASRIAFFAIGPSAPLAHYASIVLRRNGRRSIVLDATGGALADQMLDLQDGDSIVILAYGNLYNEVAAVINEAQRLRLPTVLVTDTVDNPAAGRVDIVLPVRRGRAGQVALHAVTLAAIEALVLGLAACDSALTLQTLERLTSLRRSVAGADVEPSDNARPMSTTGQDRTTGDQSAKLASSDA